MTELKPCPFCGAPGYVYDDPHGPGKPTTWVAVCEADCDAAVYFDRPTKAEAVSAWNTRHPSRNDVLEEAARESYRVCAETRHVKLGDRAADAIRALKDRDG